MHRRIEENREAEEVTIDGLVIRGWIDDAPCATCGSPRIYHEAFDAYFCASCNTWLEDPCGDPNCASCSSRPSAPLNGPV